ncbi:MAG: hypothetical protein ACC645_15170 [Pirellulales bacterium]
MSTDPPSTATAPTATTSPWLTPEGLLKQLDLLSGQTGSRHRGAFGAAGDVGSDFPLTPAAWADRVAGQVRQVAQQLARHVTSDQHDTSSDHVASLLMQLREAVDCVEPLANALEDRDEAAQLRRTGYALLRRIDIWESIVAMDSLDGPSSGRLAEPDRGIAECLDQLAAMTDDEPIARAWRDYLMLDAQRVAAPDGGLPRSGPRHALPKKVFAKIDSGLPGSQQPLVEQVLVASEGGRFQRWNSGPIDTRRVMVELEEFELSSSPSDARRVAFAHLLLSHSDLPAAKELARRIETHYRNANLRLAVSADLINRCMPQPPAEEQPVADTIAGARVRGRSQVSSRLSVRFIPDPGRIRLGLEARGTIDSNTAATRGPATFFSRGTTSYEAAKLILIGPTGVDLLPAIADAESVTVLTSLATQFDSLPLVRSLVRGMALAQHDQRLEDALREAERKVAGQIRQRFDTRAGQQIEAMQDRWRSRVLKPLDQLGLEPIPCEIRTTRQRIILRTRLASDHQLGAHTPRPRAPSTSRLSVQLHQSALQNVIDQLQLDGRRLTLPKLYRTVVDRLGLTDTAVPEDLAEDAVVQFASRHAVRVAFEGGQVRVTLAMAELSQRRRRFRNFSVTATYRPETSQGGAKLVRSGIVHLQGSRLRTRQQIVLRGVFAKLFPRNRPVSLLRQPLDKDPRFEGLEVGQFTVEDGWIGLALCPTESSLAGRHDASATLRR